MQQTQIYLGERELECLDRASQRTGASRSELIRRAVREQYGEPDFDARRAALRASAGAWKDRTFTGAEYVEAIRGDLDERLRKLGIE
ncbi:MAG TPA: CopG family transcriptional regulator [Egibacteraceae bacterium]|nr:CopG family transcriptional regulator [Egibacteraceae bacterium]